MVRKSFVLDAFAMSPSTKSKPASPSSHATGAESKGPFRKQDPDRPPTEIVEIDLEVSRQRWIAWTIGGVVGGILLILKLGTVGVWAGYVVVALGLYRAYQLVMSFVHPAGKIVIGPKQVSLPRFSGLLASWIIMPHPRRRCTAVRARQGCDS